MSENIKVDQLKLDAAAARSKGMSYGKYIQWKSMQQTEEPELIKREPEEGEVVCRNCGKIFPRGLHYRVFCSRMCRADYGNAQDRAKKFRGGLGDIR